MPTTETVSVRYMVSDVATALDFYTKHFGFEPGIVNAPAFAEATRGNLRLLISGPNSSAGRPMRHAISAKQYGTRRIRRSSACTRPLCTWRSDVETRPRASWPQPSTWINPSWTAPT